MSTLATSQLLNPDTKLALVHGEAEEKRNFIKDIDYLITTADTRKIEHLSFMVNDMPFYVTHRKNTGDGESRVCIQAVLGYLPFSIDARERRQAIRMILGATHTLLHTRFALDPYGRIFAAGNFVPDIKTSPDFIFYPLLCFLHEAQPFIDLIGEYLAPAQVAEV